MASAASECGGDSSCRAEKDAAGLLQNKVKIHTDAGEDQTGEHKEDEEMLEEEMRVLQEDQEEDEKKVKKDLVKTVTQAKKVKKVKKPACVDDATWTDKKYGDGSADCAQIAKDPLWCTALDPLLGDYDLHTLYSTEARRACPVACNSCIQDEEEELDEDEKEEDEVPAEEGTPFEDLPRAVLAGEREKREVTLEQIEAGTEFLQGQYGKLNTLFVHTAVELARYHAKVVNKAGQIKKGVNHTGTIVYEEPKKDNMTAIIKEWRAELLKFTSAKKCPEDPMSFEACVQEHRCLIEPEVGKTIKSGFFSSFVEMEDELAVCLKNFEVTLGGPSDTVMYMCAGELDNADGKTEKKGTNHVHLAGFLQESVPTGMRHYPTPGVSRPKPNEHAHGNMKRSMPDEHNMASVLQQFEASSDRQRRAVVAVAAIQQAADLTEGMATATDHAAIAEWEGIWHPACSHLGCDHNSFMDIVQAMHAHSAELVEVEAPAAAIRIYVRAMRKAIRAQKVWIGRAAAGPQAVALAQQGNFDQKFIDGVTKPGQHAAANRGYTQMLKNVGGMLDGAYMELKGSSVRLTGFFDCWGAYAEEYIAYAKKFLEPLSVYGAAVSLTLSLGVSIAGLQTLEATNLIPGSKVALKGGKDGKYCADEGNTVKCNRCGIGGWEKFDIVDAGSGKIALKGGKDGKYCADEGNTVKCNRGGIGGWEKFVIVDAGSGKIALKGGKDNKYCADEGNTVTCNRGAIGGWEKFTVECLEGCATNQARQSHKLPLSNFMQGAGSEKLSGNGAGSQYQGAQTRTRSGYTCQKWTDQSPHGHSNTPENRPGMGLGYHNFCRNPDGEPTIWCYTTSSTRWELCDPIPNPICWNLQLKFGVLVGLVVGEPAAIGFRVGVAVAAGFSFSTCSKSITLSLSASLSGAVSWASTACPFGPSLSVFRCAGGGVVGLTFFCCNIDLLTGDNDC